MFVRWVGLGARDVVIRSWRRQDLVWLTPLWRVGCQKEKLRCGLAAEMREGMAERMRTATPLHNDHKIVYLSVAKRAANRPDSWQVMQASVLLVAVLGFAFHCLAAGS